jgi:hypothetical protein
VGFASCANQEYFETQTAARTAYEAAESARRAADAATVAAIELRLSNDRLGESADRLRNVITGDGMARRLPVTDEGVPVLRNTQVAPEPQRVLAPEPTTVSTGQAPVRGTDGTERTDAVPAATPAPSAAPAEDQGVIQALQANSSASARGADAAAKNADATATLVTSQRELIEAHRSLADTQKSLAQSAHDLAAAVKESTAQTKKAMEEQAEAVIDDDADKEREEASSMFDMDLAFGATAFLSLVALSWWAGDLRARAARDEARSDWLPVTAAAAAAIVSIALAGTAYFGVRIFRDGPTPGPHWGIPWFVMAWVWCGMVAIGLLVMWAVALAGFWNRIGAPRVADAPARTARRDDRPDVWRLWMIVLAIGALPASGLLVEGRFFMLLGMLLIVVFGAFAGMAMLATAREERRT